LRGAADCHFVEPKSNLYALIIFAPELPDRSWFGRADTIEALAADRGALMHARQSVLDILRTASAEPGLFEMTDIAEHFQEGLLLAVDELLRRGRSPDHSTGVVGERPSKLVKLLDDYLAAYPTSRIYSAELAGELGVSVRTLGSAVARVRGMSLHQYIRLKKLWTARARLLKGGGGITVATCARAQGFHHMGEFAAMYRAAFHEAPSETLARGRQSHPAVL